MIKYLDRVAREEGVDVSLGEVVVEGRERQSKGSATTFSAADGSRWRLHLGDDLVLPHAIEDVV